VNTLTSIYIAPKSTLESQCITAPEPILGHPANYVTNNLHVLVQTLPLATLFVQLFCCACEITNLWQPIMHLVQWFWIFTDAQPQWHLNAVVVNAISGQKEQPKVANNGGISLLPNVPIGIRKMLEDTIKSSKINHTARTQLYLSTA